jgi:hypothetical protein
MTNGPLTSQRAALMGRVGAYAKWSRTTDRSAATAAARAGKLAKYERQILAEAEVAGVELTPRQIADRVEARRLEQLARARLVAVTNRERRAHRAAQRNAPAGTTSATGAKASRAAGQPTSRA